MSYMKKSLDLKKDQIGSGNIAAVSTNIVMRALVGFLSDLMGPRRCLAFLLLITCPAIVGMMFVQDASAWIACRAIIGIALATFVTCQVWCSQVRPPVRLSASPARHSSNLRALGSLDCDCPQRRCSTSRWSASPMPPPPAGATSEAASPT